MRLQDLPRKLITFLPLPADSNYTKQWREDNQDKVKSYHKKYYKKNRTSVLARAAQRRRLQGAKERKMSLRRQRVIIRFAFNG